MKWVKTIGLVLLVNLIFSDCTKKKAFEKLHFEGNVYDFQTQMPLEGYTVQIKACVPNTSKDLCDNFVVGTATTDAQGHFVIDEKAARSNRYFINVAKVGSNQYLHQGGKLSAGVLNSQYSKIYI